MVKLGSGLGGGLLSQEQLECQLCNRGHLQTVVHASKCRNDDCNLPGCPQMQTMIEHVVDCKTKANHGCRVCKRLIASCCYHPIHCQEVRCSVPFCTAIKRKLRQCQLHQGFEALMLKRLASIQYRRISLGAPQSNAASNSSRQPSPGVSDLPKRDHKLDHLILMKMVSLAMDLDH